MKWRVNCEGFSENLAWKLKNNFPLPPRGRVRERGPSLMLPPHPGPLPRERRIVVAAILDPEMQLMNLQFRGKNKTTDVLTFVDSDLTEIYISLPVARRQARERGVTLAQECQRLLVHGLCHAQGMDHHTREGFMQMRRREFEILVQWG